MIWWTKALMGIIILALGFPLGDLLRRYTKDENVVGQFWFKVIIILAVIGAVLALVFREDSLFFTFVFIVIVTARSLKR